jgi:hypothetical protein
MGILDSINPVNWVKKLLVSDYVGGLIRHGLTFLGGWLVAKGLAAPEVADQATNALLKLLTDEKFIGGLISVFGIVASAANKKA